MTAQHNKDIQDAIIRNRHSSGVDRFVSKEAADIYRLRAALKRIAEFTNEAGSIARKALAKVDAQ